MTTFQGKIDLIINILHIKLRPQKCTTGWLFWDPKKYLTHSHLPIAPRHPLAARHKIRSSRIVCSSQTQLYTQQTKQVSLLLGHLAFWSLVHTSLKDVSLSSRFCQCVWRCRDAFGWDNNLDSIWNDTQNDNSPRVRLKGHCRPFIRRHPDCSGWAVIGLQSLQLNASFCHKGQRFHCYSFKYRSMIDVTHDFVYVKL